MTNKIQTISIKKNDQSYLKRLLIDYPKISSGRKNYANQYNRVLKNILLSKAYDRISIKKPNIQKKFFFKEKGKILLIKFKL